MTGIAASEAAKANALTSSPMRASGMCSQPSGIHLPAQCLTAETAGLLRGEADRLTARIDCLTRNRDAIRAYLAAIQPGRPPDR